MAEKEKRLVKYPDCLHVFMFEFKWNEKLWCIDAANDDGSFGRLANDEHKSPNCRMKTFIHNGKPHLCLFAIRDINPGDEITYNYGNSDWPWRDEVEETVPASSSPNSQEVDKSYSPSPDVAQPRHKKVKKSSLETTQVEETVPASSSANSQEVDKSYSPSPDVAQPRHKKVDARASARKATQKMKHISCYNDDSDYSLDNSEAEYVPDLTEESSDDSSNSEAGPWKKSKTGIKEKRGDSIPNAVLSGDTSGEKIDERPGPVSVPAVSNKEHGTRVYNKKQYCLYCEKAFCKISRHMEHVHNNEPEVAQALMFPKCSKERRLHFLHLRNRGNFHHNCTSIQSGSGVLVPCKQPKKDEASQNYLHCVNCQGLFARKYMWRHMKKCPLKKKSNQPGKNRAQALCAFAQPVPSGIESGFWKLLTKMMQDEIFTAIKNDSCIMQLGQQFYNKIGSDLDKHEYIRQKLREVGRLLLVAKKNTNASLLKVEDFIIPSNFFHVVDAVKEVAGYDNDRHTFKVPSLALKLGHSLTKISSILECRGLMDGINVLVDNARNFRKIYETRWNELISFAALTTLMEAKWNAPQVLPFTEDIKKCTYTSIQNSMNSKTIWKPILQIKTGLYFQR
ncbi:uncharacterized protein LOC143804702 [Ranitomeya variabilis]|uniref:uncharacterized protein LOC143804702 n=1 Tax=Ranitomeya variabilis TaxID=490064 RepID=UPI0040560FB1